MAYDSLAALGDPTRRAIFERLAAGPVAVGEIARDLPVSRPAVSQHLKVLKEAGLVVDRPAGARRLYQLDPDGVAALRGYFDQFLEPGACCVQGGRPATQGGVGMTQSASDLTIHKTITVDVSQDRAFTMFAQEMGSWWPLDSKSIGVEVRFIAAGPMRTRVELEHRGLPEAYGDRAGQLNAIFDSVDGWSGILAAFGELANA
jgi:DNA-binding transcriptional ArsR family regulator